MTCRQCEPVFQSGFTTIFVPPGGTLQTLVYRCTYCSQGWWQYDDIGRCWAPVPSDVYEAVANRRSVMVDIPRGLATPMWFIPA